MSEIVKRLTSSANVFYEWNCDEGALFKDAAAEIQRLSTALENARKAMKPFVPAGRLAFDNRVITLDVWVASAQKEQFKEAFNKIEVRDLRIIADTYDALTPPTQKAT